MRVLAAEPYGTASHRLFVEGLAAHSSHRIEPLFLPGRAWKWRMRTASLAVADALAAGGHDLLLASDYLSLPETVAALPREQRGLPTVLYLHENQLTYPLPPDREADERDLHFGLVNVHSILAADAALFNSRFHRDELLRAAGELLAKAPDLDAAAVVARLRRSSDVLPLGTDVPAGEPRGADEATEAPVVLWPHRWEYDKAPERLLAALVELDRRGERFRLRLLGRRFRARPPALAELEARFADRIVASDFLDRNAYLAALRASDVVVSTAKHEFFGLAVLEALRSGALPVLPDDLAYPELVPRDGREAWLHERGDLVEALARALETARSGALLERRRALVAHTDRFTWPQLAPRFDRVFEEAVRP